MTFPLRFEIRRWAGAVVLAAAVGGGAAAQCPIPAQCVPGRASNANAALFGLGITNVTLGSINNTTAGQADGYQDYGCTQQAALVVGRSYTLSVTAGGAGTSAGGGENTGAWIDYNNNGSFNDPGEAVMAVAPAPAGAPTNSRLHLATFTVPAGAVTGLPLRLRINSDLVTATPLPGPCTTPQYSQCEDYAVVLGTNASPPAAALTANATTTCDGCVQFADASQNVPTGWSWNFGDGSAPSTAQNPRYCYLRPGTYNVTLTATNAAGSSTSAATAITYNTRVPRAACVPTSANPAGANGVVRLQLGRINNASTGAAAGYQDFSCTVRDSLFVGRPYPITLTLASPVTANQDTRVYVDLNDNGLFEANELLLSFLATGTPSGTLNLPASTVVNRPLRLRVVSDGGGTNPTACASQSGQAEDYTLVALPDTAPPTVSFTTDFVPGNCTNPVQFTSTTTGNPTSFRWDFGNGLTSTQPNPSHQYAATGSYTVTLTVTNANGSTTFTSPTPITIQVPCFIYCGANGSGMGGGASPLWMTTFGLTAAGQVPGGPALAAFSYQGLPANAGGGYGNYTTEVITLRAGQQHTATVVGNVAFNRRTTIWIDYDRDGVFDNSATSAERVANFQGQLQTHALPFTVPLSVNGVNTVGQTRLRVIVAANQNQPNPCGRNQPNAEVEDYAVSILPRILGTRAADALPTLGLYPNPTPDGRLTLTLAAAAAAGPYAATVHNVLGATVLHAALRLAPAAPATLDLQALPPGVYVLRLVDAAGRTALRRVVRE